ncbi:hypothetical protein K438DRAFT_1760011 [Mycena galopus ATCC 62051]|nr:hypothetical protein K438DRAFT_1760011 [Mycena galopus ATCC 62051]
MKGEGDRGAVPQALVDPTDRSPQKGTYFLTCGIPNKGSKLYHLGHIYSSDKQVFLALFITVSIGLSYSTALGMPSEYTHFYTENQHSINIQGTGDTGMSGARFYRQPGITEIIAFKAKTLWIVSQLTYINPSPPYCGTSEEVPNTSRLFPRHEDRFKTIMKPDLCCWDWKLVFTCLNLSLLVTT